MRKTTTQPARSQELERKLWNFEESLRASCSADEVRATSARFIALVISGERLGVKREPNSWGDLASALPQSLMGDLASKLRDMGSTSVELGNALLDDILSQANPSRVRDMMFNRLLIEPPSPGFVMRYAISRAFREICADGIPASLRVLDPACGTGVALVEALRQLVDRRGGSVEHALSCLQGYDIAQSASSIAMSALFAEAVSLDIVPPTLERHTGLAQRIDVRHIDALALSSNETAALVICEPPRGWLGRDTAQSYQERLKLARSLRVSVAALFVEAALEYARPQAGWIGLLLPAGMFQRNWGRDVIEKVLARRCNLIELVDLSSVYLPGHGTPQMLLLGRAEAPTPHCVRVVRAVRAEASLPSDPALGVVWSRIKNAADDPTYSDEYIRITQEPQAKFAVYPWSMTEPERIPEPSADSTIGFLGRIKSLEEQLAARFSVLDEPRASLGFFARMAREGGTLDHLAVARLAQLRNMVVHMANAASEEELAEGDALIDRVSRQLGPGTSSIGATPTVGRSLLGRDELVRRIKKSIVDRHSVGLWAMRRAGKTSVLRALVAEMTADGARVVSLDPDRALGNIRDWAATELVGSPASDDSLVAMMSRVDLIVIDDAHLLVGCPGFEAFLELLLRLVHVAPFLIALEGTSASGAFESLPGLTAHLDVFHLGPLSISAIAEMIQVDVVARGYTLDPTLVERMAHFSGGWPFDARLIAAAVTEDRADLTAVVLAAARAFATRFSLTGHAESLRDAWRRQGGILPADSSLLSTLEASGLNAFRDASEWRWTSPLARVAVAMVSDGDFTARRAVDALVTSVPVEEHAGFAAIASLLPRFASKSTISALERELQMSVVKDHNGLARALSIKYDRPSSFLEEWFSQRELRELAKQLHIAWDGKLHSLTEALLLTPSEGEGHG